MAGKIITALVAAYLFITLIDMPKLNSFTDAKRYKAVYFLTIAAGLILGIFAATGGIVPLNEALGSIYRKLAGN